ncbi:MAG: SBBP repeat-containing protein, partial [Methanolinea sp.]|nr:SBBP repeat-containing protein [Methanolinea sp.]
MRLKSKLSVILILVAGLLALTILPVVADETVRVDVSRIPLVFIENQGQKSAEVIYHTNAAGHGIFFTPDAVVCAAGNDDAQPGSVVKISVVGQNAGIRVTGEEPLPGTANFFLGNNPEDWATSVPTFGKVRYGNVIPGVDIVYYGTQGALKRDIVLAPGIDPAGLKFHYTGQECISRDEEGTLLVETATGTLWEAAPVCYQIIGGEQIPVACEYVILGDSQVGFSVGAFDPGYPLVIDPFLDFSTYLGGSWDDQGYAVAVDALGSTYVTGKTWSTDFPITWWKSVYNETSNGGYDVFVTKFEPDGMMLNYSTYIGGNNDDSGQGIAVDSVGNAYVTGYTISQNYPAVRAFQT